MRATLYTITSIIGAALLALLAYSIERSAWLLSLYELPTDEGKQLALLAALVAESGAVALIVAEGSLSLLNRDTARQLARWAHFGLVIMLALQSVAGLVAGYTRGGARLLDTLGSGEPIARFAVAAVALLLGNLAVPALILALSKIAALLVGQLVTLPAPAGPPWYARLRTWWQQPAPAVVWARPASVEPFVQSEGVTAQSTQTNDTASTEPTAPIDDRVCKYCGAAGLAPIELARHGRARKRTGACPSRGGAA